MRKKIIPGLFLTIVCLVLLTVTACSSGAGEVANQQLVKAEPGDITVSVTGSGKIEASREARLTFGSGGKVDKILVKEGNEVKEGDLLARLDTRPLELARSQSQVALTQAELAVTQAQLAQKTAERSLKSTRSSVDTLKIALLNAQIGLEQAQNNLNTGITAVDYQLAEAELNRARAYYEYVQKNPIGDNWVYSLEKAKEKLDTAQAQYDNTLAGYNNQDLAIKKKQVEAARMALVQAQKNLDELGEGIALQELQVTSANQSAAQTRQSVELARQSLVDAQRQLDEAAIAAPFDGLVAAVMVKVGDIVPSPAMVSKTVIQLIDPDLMELVVEIDEIDIPMVRLNKEAVITVDALPDTEFKGMVVAVHPVPKEEGGVVLYNVRLSLDAPENSGIKIGMTASAKIMFEEHNQVLVVPSRAVGKNDQGKAIVKVMVNGQVQERPVVVGLDDGLRAEIVSGLSEGETVVVETRGKSATGISMFSQ